jgi:hypothetical protein
MSTPYNIHFDRPSGPKISYYYKYNFVSPESIYAEVKEELRSYFQTGVIDDILFPKYTEDLLKRLGRSSYKIEENIFKLEDFECSLPTNFVAVRELWLVTPQVRSYKMPNSCYEQAIVRINPNKADRCDVGDFCAPKEIAVTYKTTGQIIQKFECHHLLKPGNIHAVDNCSLDSFNRGSNSNDTFDIRNNKIVTNFPEGTLYMIYYVLDHDENEYQLVPDNIRIKDYIKAELKYKCFENIYNNITDETLRQIEVKMTMYERKRDEARVMAEIEIRKQTTEQQMRSIKSAKNRLRKYNIT